MQRRGIDRLVLARGIIHPNGLQAVAGALPGGELMVIRLTAPRTALEQLIRERDSGSELREHLAALDEMTQKVTAAAPGAHVVVNDGRDLDDVAREVMKAAGSIEG